MVRGFLRAAGVSAALLSGAAQGQAPGPVTLINVFDAPADQVEATIAYWEAARAILAVQPGFISTRLHRALIPGARFQLINVAEWSSAAAFQAAIAEMTRTLGTAPPPGVVYTPALYRAIRE